MTILSLAQADVALAPFGPYEVGVGERLAIGPVAIIGAVGSDTHQATVDWGDGHGSPAVVRANGTVVASHTYKRAGEYTVMLALRRTAGEVATGEATVTVVRPVEPEGTPSGGGEVPPDIP